MSLVELQLQLIQEPSLQRTQSALIEMVRMPLALAARLRKLLLTVAWTRQIAASLGTPTALSGVTLADLRHQAKRHIIGPSDNGILPTELSLLATADKMLFMFLPTLGITLTVDS